MTPQVRTMRRPAAIVVNAAGIDAFKTDATSGDCNHALATIMKYVDVE